MSHYAHSDTIVTVPDQRCVQSQRYSLSQLCGHYRAEYFRHDMRILRGTRRKETQQA